MAEPVFPEAVIGPLVYISIGVLLTLVLLLLGYIHNIRGLKDTSIDTNRLNMPKSRITVLNQVINGSIMQSELPDRTELSKATVSQALDDLYQADLIKRKKRGNTYLIEADKNTIERTLGEPE